MGPLGGLGADDQDLQAVYLENMRRAAKAGGGGGPYNAALVRAAIEFNANTSPAGLVYGFKRGPVQAVLPDLVQVRGRLEFSLSRLCSLGEGADWSGGQGQAGQPDPRPPPPHLLRRPSALRRPSTRCPPPSS
jgi:hypothetical protein